MSAVALFVALLLISLPSLAQGQASTVDSDVRKAIIAESLAGYSGPCPCPYNTARNGSRCGKRSAYSRPGGYEPICYESDVTQEMIARWRKKHPAKDTDKQSR